MHEHAGWHRLQCGVGRRPDTVSTLNVRCARTRVVSWKPWRRIQVSPKLGRAEGSEWNVSTKSLFQCKVQRRLKLQCKFLWAAGENFVTSEAEFPRMGKLKEEKSYVIDVEAMIDRTILARLYRFGRAHPLG
jgi:hypothetical protein